jgi:hypothetical protein
MDEIDGRRRRVHPPDVLDQTPRWHDPSRLHQERRKDRPLSRVPDVDWPVPNPHLYRAKQPEVRKPCHDNRPARSSTTSREATFTQPASVASASQPTGNAQRV